MITARPEAISSIVILIAVSWICSAGAEEAHSSDLPDWLGTGPIYSYGDYRSPYYFPSYYPYYYPYYHPYYDESHLIYSPSPAYSDPFRSWWVGAHEDLPKVIDIARSSSSMRVFANGAWQTL
ncbi:Uncharacterised protein [uncultured archaeon]|nr:Uncharacterised protein [uncultured archaeon]